MDYKVSRMADKEDSWEQMLTFMPARWQEKCRDLGALRRLRGFTGPGALLRTLLIHLIDGFSLRETVVHAREGNIADVSDVALLKRLNCAGAWFQWMAQELMKSWLPVQKTPLKFRLIDATHVCEPGATGAQWRIHYAFDIPDFECKGIRVTDYTVGETFKNFDIEPGVVYVADRGYYHVPGIAHIADQKGQVVVRMTANKSGPNLTELNGHPLDLFKKLRTLKGCKIGDWPVCLQSKQRKVTGRICALRKTQVSAQRAVNKVLAEHRKKQKTPSRITLEAAKYIFVFTTLSQEQLPAADVLEIYGGRWQIELVFKRLKSIIGLGHLPKQDPQGAKAWIYGKLFCALLIESLIQSAERFSPWGYTIKSETA